MTEHGHNFIREIAEAYRALEAEEGLHGQIDLMAKERIKDGETIARLEMRIMELKTSQDDLQSKVRSLEVEREDAGFRLLESEDRLDAIRRAIGMPEAIASAVAEAKKPEVVLEAVVEAKPEPVYPWVNTDQYGAITEPNRIEGEPNYVPGSFSNPLPGIIAPTDTSQQGQGVVDPTSANASSEVAIGSSGQSEADPTAPASTPSKENVPIQDLNSASPSVGSPQTSDPAKPYLGKRYVDHAYYVSLSGWLAGGGTEADYNWRPDANPPAQAAQ